MRSLLLSIVSVLLATHVAMGGEPTPLRIGFYNLENLYDTINDPSVDDGEWVDNRDYDYRRKIEELSRAISLFSPDVLGVCEVENYSTLQRLADELHGDGVRGYATVHYDSRDSRGIDVAVLYDSAKVSVLSSELVEVDFLWRGFLRVEMAVNSAQSEGFILYVLHLPSRRGGRSAQRLRNRALSVLDSLVRVDGGRRVLVCGDMNDDPTHRKELYNCAVAAFKSGAASYAYGDVWSMLDQILVSSDLVDFVRYGSQQTLIHPELMNQRGRFKGYPRKGRPSDHFPVYIEIML